MFCYLIIPAAVALLLVRRLWLVLTVATGSAVLFTLAGLYVSFAADLPTNQTICVVSVAVFLGVTVFCGLRGLWTRFLGKDIGAAPSSPENKAPGTADLGARGEEVETAGGINV